MSKDCLVGLDIGTTKVAAIVGEIERNGEVRIVGMGESPSRGIRKGVVIDIDEAAESIAAAVQAATSATGYDIHSVVVGVTGEHIASLNSRAAVAVPPTAREITADDVDRAIEQTRVIVLPPDREIINAVPRSYTVDGQKGVRYPVGMAGARLEVETHIVTGAVALLQNVARAVHKAGLSIEATVLEPIASAEALLTGGQRDLGVCLVDIGGGTSDVAIFQEGDVVYSSVIGIGGGNVTRDISIGLRMPIDEAERVKLRYGSVAGEGARTSGDYFENASLVDDIAGRTARVDLDQIIGARMEELFEHVRREVDKSGYHSLLPAGIILTGGGAQLAGAVELCRRATDLPTRLGTTPDSLKLEPRYQSPVYATGIGLVLYAARYTTATSRAYRSRRQAGQVSYRLGNWMQAIERFFSRIMGSGES